MGSTVVNYLLREIVPEGGGRNGNSIISIGIVQLNVPLDTL